LHFKGPADILCHL